MASINRYEELRRELDLKILMQQARDRAGLSDFGDERFLIALDKMLDCNARDTDFHTAGLRDYKEDIVRDLVNRLRFQNDLKHHPEILQEDVSDPIIIIGLPRCGTTKAQRMIGTDPSLLKMYLWQYLNPAPFPNAKRGQPDPRIAAAGFGDSSALVSSTGNSELAAGHHLAADQIDEDWFLFEHTFNDWYFLNRNPSRSWHDWVMSRSEPSDLYNYRFVRTLYQYLQWQQGGRRGRRWLMKHTGHIAHLQVLLDMFPRATMVHFHRDPMDCIPSYAKIFQASWGTRASTVDPVLAGDLVLEWAGTAMTRYLEARKSLGLEGRIIDVQYDQIRNDPMPVIRDLYARASQELTHGAEQGMMQWERDNEQGKHGKHVYSLEQFGLTRQKIEDALSGYIQRFISR